MAPRQPLHPLYHFLNRIAKTATITLVACMLLTVVLGFAAYELFQGARWKKETERFAESAGRSDALNRFMRGHRCKYLIDGKRDQETHLNKMEGPFQLIAIFYQPVLGRAHRVATEAYVSAFNDQMDVMIKNPRRFLGEPYKSGAANLNQPVGSETNRASATAGSDG